MMTEQLTAAAKQALALTNRYDLLTASEMVAKQTGVQRPLIYSRALYLWDCESGDAMARAERAAGC
jgi:hypothetical protein